MVHARLLFLGFAFFLTLTPFALAQDKDQKFATQKKYGLIANTELIDRVQRTPDQVQKLFKDSGLNITPHNLTKIERGKLENALAGLPPFHKRVLKDRLRSISFVNGMPNSALTSTINYDDPYRLCDITIRAAVLKEDVSQWLT